MRLTEDKPFGKCELRVRAGYVAQIDWRSGFFPKSHGKRRVDDRRVLSGIIFINRNGLRWRDSPKEYGPFKTLYNRWKWWDDKLNGVDRRQCDCGRTDRDDASVEGQPPRSGCRSP